MATLKWNGAKCKRAWRLEAAQRVHNAAVFFVKEAEKLLGNPHPPASKPGQYPRKRSGILSRGITFTPSTVMAIYRTLRVKMGYTRKAWYGTILEKKRKRLGLQAMQRRLRKQLANVVAGRGPYSRRTR